jgi:hypothetical protein
MEKSNFLLENSNSEIRMCQKIVDRAFKGLKIVLRTFRNLCFPLRRNLIT